MKIQHSQEDYLEAILVLSQSSPAVRSVDIAEHLGYSKPSISRALAQLVEAGYAVMDDGKFITLTDAGKEKAKKVYEKHVFFKNMLSEAGVDDALAAEDACKIEHAISDESFRAVKAAYEQNHSIPEDADDSP